MSEELQSMVQIIEKKLTGGQYNILNIPLEDEKGLLGFYDRMKKCVCPLQSCRIYS